MRIEGGFHGAMKLADLRGGGQFPPGFLGEADAVFAGDGAAPGHDLGEQFVQRVGGTFFSAGLREIHHDIGMDVAIAGMAEAGELQSMFALQLGGELKQIGEAAARDHDVFV